MELKNQKYSIVINYILIIVRFKKFNQVRIFVFLIKNPVTLVIQINSNMKILNILLALVLLVSFYSCEKQGDNEIDVTFLQLNDVYEIAPISNGREAGMARVETVHQELLNENPNTYMFLDGDFLSPSLLGTLKYEGEKVAGRQMVEVMNAMNFDLVIFGNHEFDLKQKDFQKRLNESTFPWTVANAFHKVDEVTGPFYVEHEGVKHFIPDTYIIEAKDADGTHFKMGFFSVCIPSNQPDYVVFTDIFEAAQKAYKKLSKEADVVFALTHLDVDDDKKLAEMLPGIPLIMGGHEHYNMLVPVGNTKIAKADANARTVYIHNIHYNTKTKEVEVNSVLKPITDEIAADPEVDKIVNKWQVIMKNKVGEVVAQPDEVIYVASTPLDGRETNIRSEQTNLGQIIAASMQEVTEADCAFFNGGSVRIDDQLHGNITPVDIFRTLPYGGAIFTIKVKGDFLKEILDFGRNHKGKGAYLQRAKADWDHQSNQWMIDGKVLNPNKKYTVAITDFLLSGYDIPFLTHENEKIIKVSEPAPDQLAFDIRKAVVYYFKSQNN